VVGLVGENGSGKSTLMKILVGALAADAGAVSVSGPLGHCPQEPVLYERLTCAEHGIDMATSMTHQKAAVASGYWPLYRYYPSPAEGTQPFQLDAKRPTLSLKEFALTEARFAMLARSDPERARHLLALAQADVDERWRYYEQLAGERRSVPQDHGGGELPAVEDAPEEEPL
jgi:ATPase subunit of ABC transporter with duplicated ATPase domains